MKALIVDDEALARRRVRRLLESQPERFDVREAANGLEALHLIRSEPPALLFLDIEMPGLSGFDLLQNLEERPFRLIFQTAYDEFALKAFEENACDYLLKPFTEERFRMALKRAMESVEIDRKLQGLESAFRAQNRFLERLTVRQGAKQAILPIGDVAAFTSKDHYTFAHAGRSEHILDVSLSLLEERIDPTVFRRVHRNGIVRMAEIHRLHGGENMEIELRSGLVLPVSRANRGWVREFVRG